MMSRSCGAAAMFGTAISPTSLVSSRVRDAPRFAIPIASSGYSTSGSPNITARLRRSRSISRSSFRKTALTMLYRIAALPVGGLVRQRRRRRRDGQDAEHFLQRAVHHGEERAAEVVRARPLAQLVDR